MKEKPYKITCLVENPENFEELSYLISAKSKKEIKKKAKQHNIKLLKIKRMYGLKLEK